MVAQWQVIPEFVGWRCQREIENNDRANSQNDIQHFKPRKKGKGLAMIMDDAEVVFAKLREKQFADSRRLVLKRKVNEMRSKYLGRMWSEMLENAPRTEPHKEAVRNRVPAEARDSDSGDTAKC